MRARAFFSKRDTSVYGRPLWQTNQLLPLFAESNLLINLLEDADDPNRGWTRFRKDQNIDQAIELYEAHAPQLCNSDGTIPELIPSDIHGLPTELIRSVAKHALNSFCKEQALGLMRTCVDMEKRRQEEEDECPRADTDRCPLQLARDMLFLVRLYVSGFVPATQYTILVYS